MGMSSSPFHGFATFHSAHSLLLLNKMHVGILHACSKIVDRINYRTNCNLYIKDIKSLIK